MIYNDFINLLKRAEILESPIGKDSVDPEAYPMVLKPLEASLDHYFNNGKERQCAILKKRMKGETYEEIGSSYNLTRERIRQIIDRTLKELRDPNHIESNKDLSDFYSRLCQLGPGEIKAFLYWLIPQKHIILLIVGEEWYKYALQFEKFIHKNAKRKTPAKPRDKLAKEKDIRDGIKRFLSSHDSCHLSFSHLADFLVENYKTRNTYGFTAKVTWNGVLTALYDMEYDGEIVRPDPNTIVLKI